MNITKTQQNLKTRSKRSLKGLKAETEYTATATEDGLFIDHKKGDHDNDYSLTLDDGKIWVSYSGDEQAFETLEEAGNYLIEQLNF